MSKILNITREDNLYYWLDTINEIVENTNLSISNINITNNNLVLTKNNGITESISLNTNIVTSINDMKGEVILKDYISSISISGRIVTITKKDGSVQKLTTQDTIYTLPEATSTTLGGVKIGSNITNSSGTISLTKSNVTSALGYTPPEQDTIYTLPKATSTTLGGVKIGSNITNSSGTISLTKSNVTSALGYTPATEESIVNIQSNLNNVLFKSGGTMSGVINMNGQNIRGINHLIFSNNAEFWIS